MSEQAAMPLQATGPTVGPEVMVSYSSQDRPRVLEIVQRLRMVGMRVEDPAIRRRRIVQPPGTVIIDRFAEVVVEA